MLGTNGTDEIGKRAVGYVRVSTEEQANEGYSISAQEGRIRDYCRARGWTLRRVYRDEGVSAFSGEQRPGYEAMLRARDDWDVIVVLKMDRMDRNVRRFLGFVDDLRTWGKEFVSVSESWDTTTPMGTFVRDLFARLAQLESEQISYRVKLAFHAKMANGNARSWLSRPPLGYDLVNGALTVNDTEARIVRRIFAAIVRGTPTMEIVDELDRDGIRGKSSGRIAQVSVLQIARNPVYAGYIAYENVVRKNHHVPIVSEEEFNEAQIALYARSSRSKKYPLILGADEIAAKRVQNSGRGAAAHVPVTRPADLAKRVAAYRGRGR